MSIEQKVQQAESTVKPWVLLQLCACVCVCVWKIVLKLLNAVQRSKNMRLLEELYLIKSEQKGCVISSRGQRHGSSSSRIPSFGKNNASQHNRVVFLINRQYFSFCFFICLSLYWSVLGISLSADSVMNELSFFFFFEGGASPDGGQGVNRVRTELWRYNKQELHEILKIISSQQPLCSQQRSWKWTFALSLERYPPLHDSRWNLILYSPTLWGALLTDQGLVYKVNRSTAGCQRHLYSVILTVWKHPQRRSRIDDCNLDYQECILALI